MQSINKENSITINQLKSEIQSISMNLNQSRNLENDFK